MTRKELLKSREYWIVKVQIDLFNLIENYRVANHLTKTQIAEKLGVTKGYVTQILNGDFDHKVSKLVDLALAFGKVPVLNFEDYEQYCDDDEMGITEISLYERPIVKLDYKHYTTVNEKAIEAYS
jgi:transcriptional regulator with XRE-family HTH domain